MIEKSFKLLHPSPKMQLAIKYYTPCFNCLGYSNKTQQLGLKLNNNSYTSNCLNAIKSNLKIKLYFIFISI